MNKEDQPIQEQKDRNSPSRFPEVFRDLEAEERAAENLRHLVEDIVILGDHPEIPGFPGALGDGIRDFGVRYLDVLDQERDNVPYDEWLLETLDGHYWRIILRTNYTDTRVSARIISIVEPKRAKNFILQHCGTNEG